MTKPEQVTAAGKAQLEAGVRIATIATAGAEKLLDLQFRNIRTSFDEALRSAKAFSELKDVAQIGPWLSTAMQPNLDKYTRYAKSVYELASETQSEISALLEEQVSEFNKTMTVALDTALKSAPAGSESAVAAAKSVIEIANSVFDTVSKASKQLSAMTETNVAATSSKKKAS